MGPKSVLILTTPYTWLSDYTPEEKWLGGFVKDGKPFTGYDGIKSVVESLGLK